MITVIAPAKINLCFQVAELAADGYHQVNSLYLSLDLVDRLSIVEKTSDSPVGISISSTNLPARHVNSVPTDQSNLVYRVAEQMFESAGVALAGFDVVIEKNIPVAGGMAGGSADAAAMLVACNNYLHQKFGRELLSSAELLELAKNFGSDVPFSLLGGLALGTNRGEMLQPLEPLNFECFFVIAISPTGLSTPQVFARFDELGQVAQFTDLAAKINDVSQLANLMSNDLEAAAITLLPSIRNTIDALELSGALRAMVTGSGPTVIGLFADADTAGKAAQTVTEMGLIGLIAQPSYRGTRLES